MKKSLKDSHIYGVIGVGTLVLVTLFSQMQASAPKTVQLAQVTPVATLALSPASNSFAQSGTLDVNVVLNTNGQAIYGVDLNRITFNPAILQVEDADPVASGIQITDSKLMPLNFLNVVDNTAGTIQFSQVANPGTTHTASGVLASIKFRGQSGGTSPVTIEFTLGSGTDSNVAGLGGDILASVTNGSYTVIPPDSIAPTAPGTPTLNVISASQINLSWTAATDNIGVTGYRVERCSGSATCTNFLQIATPSGLTYNDTGLSASTIYRYRVRAVDAAGNPSSYSTIANATTLPPPDTTAPTISAIAFTVTTTGATITWTTNEPADTQVDYGLTTSYGQSTTLNSTLSTAHSATLTGLSPGTQYHYRVRSKDAAGNPSPPADNTLTTAFLADSTSPSKPTGVTASPTSETQIQLNWTVTPDPAGPGQTSSGVTSYEIYRGTTLIATSPTASYLDTGLTGGTAYSYQIVAVDAANNKSVKSDAVTATTPTFSLAVQRRIILNLEGAPATKRNVSGVVEYLNPTTLAKVTGSVTQGNITTDNFGRYTMDIPSGLIPIVTMRAVIPGYLSKLVANVDLRDSAILDVTFPMLPAGDFNTDKLINSIDYSYMNGKWGTADAVADLNRDGAVNSIDYSYLSNNWSLVGE